MVHKHGRFTPPITYFSDALDLFMTTNTKTLTSRLYEHNGNFLNLLTVRNAINTVTLLLQYYFISFQLRSLSKMRYTERP